MLIKPNFYQNPSWLFTKNNFEVEAVVTIVCDELPTTSDVTVKLTRPNAAFNLFITGRGQTGQIIITVNHLAPKTKSVIMSAVILEAKDKLFLKTNIILEWQAKGACTQTELRALGANPEKITLEPNLEIKSQPEKAAHAATAGAFDEIQMAYLAERGITKARAKNLLAAAFLDHARKKFFTLTAMG